MIYESKIVSNRRRSFITYNDFTNKNVCNRIRNIEKIIRWDGKDIGTKVGIRKMCIRDRLNGDQSLTYTSH